MTCNSYPRCWLNRGAVAAVQGIGPAGRVGFLVRLVAGAGVFLEYLGVPDGVQVGMFLVEEDFYLVAAAILGFRV